MIIPRNPPTRKSPARARSQVATPPSPDERKTRAKPGIRKWGDFLRQEIPPLPSKGTLVSLFFLPLNI